MAQIFISENVHFLKVINNRPVPGPFLSFYVHRVFIFPGGKIYM